MAVVSWVEGIWPLSPRIGSSRHSLGQYALLPECLYQGIFLVVIVLQLRQPLDHHLDHFKEVDLMEGACDSSILSLMMPFLGCQDHFWEDRAFAGL